MKIRVDLSSEEYIAMKAEVGSGKAMKSFTAKAPITTTKKEAIKECYKAVLFKRADYFDSLRDLVD